MEVIRLTYPHQLLKTPLPNTVAAIGFFDGLHNGHRAVIEKAVQIANESNRESAVISFTPHPLTVLSKEEIDIQYVTTLREKITLFEKLKIDRFYIITFDKQLSQLSPEQFLDHFIHGLHITHVVAGFDFTFGHKGIGNSSNLKEFSSKPIDVTVMDAVTYDDEKISTTRIKKLIKNGEVERVKPLLGRYYETTGTVIQGDSRGHTLGFPTANLSIAPDKLLPKKGVYAVKVYWNDEIYYGMTNIGVKPTFSKHAQELSVETHILDFTETIYGEQLVVEWIQHIRSEKKFSGIDEIVAQLKKDEANVRKLFQIER
ncbi:MAG TPA: bifunctional riboflavin kinase/FAD synthetase [Pseudogracilibacillus sp.]|nr:bifunctional riboflavin kinase/FAD synthetase [Pseudogracilibacillus sp.]